MEITRRQTLMMAAGMGISNSFSVRAARYVYMWNFGNCGGARLFETVHRIMRLSAPISVSATGVRLPVCRRSEEADLLHAIYEYPGFILSYESRRMPGRGTQGIRFFEKNGEGFVSQAPVEEASTKAALVACLGQIAFRTSRRLYWDATREDFMNDGEASRLLRQVTREA